MVEEEKKLGALPIISPLKVIDYRTIKKGSGWWLAVVLVESWGKRNIGIYLWQRKKDGRWHRKQKFTIHTKEKWDLISEAVEDLIKDM
jgi:hypothetical protein